MSTSHVFDTQVEGDTLLVISLGYAGSLAGDQMAFELPGLTGQFKQSDLKNVVIDLEKSSWFGTSMLQVMAAMWKHVRAGGGKLALCNVSETGREVLQVTRFDTLWDICSSREEALKAVAA